MPDDKNGRWVTINGTHIFIKDGQTVEEAFAEFEGKRTKTADAIISKIKYADAHFWYYDKDNKRIMPKKWFTEKLRNALKQHPIRDADIEEAISVAMNNKVEFFVLQDHGVSDFTQDEKRIRINMDVVFAQCVEVMCHEIGHAMDNIGWNKWLSSTFVSPTHGKTMVDMLREELSAPGMIDMLTDEWANLIDLRRQVTSQWAEKAISKKEYLYKYTAYNEAQGDLCDIIQMMYGNQEAKKRCGYLAHPSSDYAGYNADRHRRLQGTELFAELTASKATDDETRFYGIMDLYCPKTVEIYKEIIEEVKRNG